MKIIPDQTSHHQTVTGYSDDAVEINGIRYSRSLIVLPDSEPEYWPIDSFEELDESHFLRIAEARPDVLIVGTGQCQRFVNPALTARLFSSRIGVECMDNKAACRTYNILTSEGRKVALALIFESIRSQ